MIENHMVIGDYDDYLMDDVEWAEYQLKLELKAEEDNEDEQD